MAGPVAPRQDESNGCKSVGLPWEEVSLVLHMEYDRMGATRLPDGSRAEYFLIQRLDSEAVHYIGILSYPGSDAVDMFVEQCKDCTLFDLAEIKSLTGLLGLSAEDLVPILNCRSEGHTASKTLACKPDLEDQRGLPLEYRLNWREFDRARIVTAGCGVERK